MRYFLLVLFLLFLASVLFCGVDSVDVGTVTDSLSNAEKSLTKAGKLSSVTSVLKYGSAAAHLATAVMETIKLIKTFVKPNDESKEMKFMKEQFAVVNNKLDALDHDFQEVKAQIDWNTIKVNLGVYENTINALHQLLVVYLDAPVDAKDSFRDLFMMSYRFEYDDATVKVYNSLTKPGIFHKDLFGAVRTFFKEDYRKVAHFTSMAMRILQKGRFVNAAYLQFENDTRRIEDEKKAWIERQKTLEETARKVDAAVEAAWSTQYPIDANELTVRQAGNFNNAGFSKMLHTFLTEKFPWRSWFVLVYTFTGNNDKDRYFDNCGEFYKVNVAKKVVIVNQVPTESSATINIKRFWDAVRGIHGVWGPYVVAAKRLFEKTSSSCKFYNFKGVIEKKADVRINAKADRFFTKETIVMRLGSGSKKYGLYVFA